MNLAATKISQAAFTLIELLTVIGIIALLSGITLPVFSKVREQANVTRDISNLRQLGVGMRSYLIDYDNSFPGAHWPASITPKYLGSWQIYKSLFDKRPASEIMSNAPVSYDLNGNLWGSADVFIESARSCILMAPLMANTAPLQFSSTGESASQPSPLSITSNGCGSSGGTAGNGTQITALFVDGHAGNLSMSDFHSPLKNPNTRSAIQDIRWNK